MPVPPAPIIKVIGVGNDWRGDDAAGPLVARLLLADGLSGITVCESRGEATDLLQLWRDAEVVIIVDAIFSEGQPGRIQRFEAKGRALGLHFGSSCSTHSWGLAEALALGSVFQELPRHLIIFGVEGRNFEVGQDLTPEVRAAIPEVAQRVRTELEKLQKGARPSRRHPAA
jgi:hydrogenase maturation protease